MPTTKTINFLPAIFQTDTNKKFLNATLDQLVTEPNLIPINGYVGRKFAPGFKGISTYIKESSDIRADYQLEPSLVYKNATTGAVEFQATYPEILQKISYYGGKVDNQDNLWGSEYYSYNPRINADAFINFGQYYWLPNGPDPVQVFAGQADLERTFFVYPDAGSQVYNISGYGKAPNPDLVLARGGNYSFVVNQPGKKFYIQTEPGLNDKSVETNINIRQVLGVTNNGDDVGTIMFNVPQATAQDFFVNMPVVQQVDLVTTLSYAELQGQLLSTITGTYGGIDGQKSNLNNKYLIFGTPYSNSADWTYNSVTVPTNQRYGIWLITLTPTTGDFIINLTYYTAIPANNKVYVMSGINFGNTQWYKNVIGDLLAIPPITAPLDTLYYQDSVDANEYGIIRLVDQGTVTIDVETQILGKTAYISPNGVNFTNGLKVEFDSSVTPTSYQNKQFYVDGVGKAIELIAVDSLVINEAQNKTNYNPEQSYVLYASAELNTAADQLSIHTTDFPDGVNVAIGTFPNSDNKNAIVDQNLNFTYPFRAGQNIPGDHENILYSLDAVGVTLPGIVINGMSNGAYVPGSSSTQWHYDTNQVMINGNDQYGGVVLDNGRYVYTNGNFITANAWGNVSGFTNGYTSESGHSSIIGFAADGYPIYGPFGYSNPTNAESPITRMTSSYQSSSNGLYRPAAKTVTVTVDAVDTKFITVGTTLGINPGMRLTNNNVGITPNSVWIINNGLKTAVGLEQFTGTARQIQLNTEVTIPAGTEITFEFLAGAFIEDYSYYQGSGSLDQFNGRYCVTPEFPNGTYAYFVTETLLAGPVFPYIIGSALYGSRAIDTNTSLSTPDYIVINRASRDLNPWSRRNRWFHKSIIEQTSFYNNTPQIFKSDDRAKRPIIEYDPNIQLLNFGKTAKVPVDLYDNTFTNPFLTVEGSQGVFIDGIALVDGMRVVFAADADPTTRNKIWVVNFVNVTSSNDPKIIHLTEATDGNVVAYDTVSVFNGVTNNGKSFWFDGTNWILGQQKTSLNQFPYFDVFDNNGISFSDITQYPIINNETKFTGTPIFNYRIGTGTPDPILGFPLTYKNFNNVGDIQFNNYFDTQTFSYEKDNVTFNDVKIHTGFLHQNTADGDVVKLNVWTNVNSLSRQMQDIAFTYDGVNNYFQIDILPNLATTEPNLLIYVNAKKIGVADYQLFNLPDNNLLITITPALLAEGDRIDVLVYSDSISQLGFYQVPTNLNLNAQNADLQYPTLGEMRNHIGDLAENNLNFLGSYPGVSNLRDLFIDNEPGTMLQQSAPVTYAGLFLNNPDYNFVDSLLYASQEYTKFKNKFITIAGNNNKINPADPVAGVDIIMAQINAVKDKTFPWYYSGTVPNGDNKNTITYTIFNPAQKNYEITAQFNNDIVTNKAILVYLNSVQLIYGLDYVFLKTGPGIEITDSITLEVDDTLTIVEYADTDGCWVPETPSKLGLYPKFTPEIYTDYTYQTPTQMIRGHDGSLTPAFGDFRDQLLLELEKRIYNNIKVEYSDRLVNIYDSIPGKFRNTGYTISEFNNLLGKNYLQWVGLNNLDYTTNTTYQDQLPFTYNYGQSLDIIDGQKLQGSWRAVYEYFYDTQYPDTKPWEMLGFSEMPDWWENTYGPAPYTSGNTILWTDLQNGYIADGVRKGIDQRFVRPGLLNIIPVSLNGELLPPIGLLTTKYNVNTFAYNWAIGQFSPVETAWRNSSSYPFAIQYACAMVKPAKYFSLGLNTNLYRYDVDLEQYVVVGTNNRLTPKDVKVNGYTSAAGVVNRVTGYLNWVTDYQTALGVLDKKPLQDYVNNFTLQLAYRMAGFSGKQYLKVLAEQNSPTSTNETIIIPDPDFDVVLTKSSPVINARYSAVIIEKTSGGFKIAGYDTAHPYFTIIPPQTSGTSTDVTVLDSSVNFYKEFTNFKVSIPYGTVFTTIQQIASFFAGYQRYLNALGFRFDYFDEQLGQIRNWELSTKEFLFWNQQGWGPGNIIVVGPAADRIKLVSSTATVDAITNSYLGSKALNQNFQTLGTDNYDVIRDNNTFSFRLVNTTDLIGFIDLNLVQYEHVLIFNNKTQFSDIIYDPVLGQRQFRLKLVGSKTGDWTGLLAAPGFVYNQSNVQIWVPNRDYLKSDLVDYKGFYYSANKNLPGSATFNFNDWLPVNKNNIRTGLINNFARNASLGETFYNVDKVNLESDFDLYGLSLIGFKNRDYLNQIGLDDTAQVKFYQGFIKEKGTYNAIDALGQITVLGQPGEVSISEDWAFRVGTYGSLDTNQFVEITLDEQFTLSNPTSLEVLPNLAIEYSSLYTLNEGLYKASDKNFTTPFLLTRTVDSDYTDDIKTAGYVNIEDVDFTCFDISNINTLNTTLDKVGASSIIWVAKDYTQQWNIYRVAESECRAIVLSNALNGKILVTTNIQHKLSINDVILIKNTNRFNGFFKVESVESLDSFIISYSGNLIGFSKETANGSIQKLISLKVTLPTEINAIKPYGEWAVNDKVWVDSATPTGEWGVFNKSEPWELDFKLAKSSLTINSQFGAATKISTNGKFVVAGAPGFNNNVGAITNYITNFDNQLVEDITLTTMANNTVRLGEVLSSGTDYILAGTPESSSNIGYVFTYGRGTFGTLSELQILSPVNNSAGKFGYSVALSKDDAWAYVGAPDDDCVYIYTFNKSIGVSNVTVTANGIDAAFSLDFTPYSADTISVRSATRNFVPNRDYTVSGTTINFVETPAAGQIVINQAPCYSYVGQIQGNAGTKFGYSLSTTTDGAQIIIGCPATDSFAGKIEVYDRSVEVQYAGLDQSLFSYQTALDSTNKVYLNDVLQVNEVDYYIFNSTYIQFFDPLPASSKVTVETNIFRKISDYVPDVPYTGQRFGFSVDICPNNCSIYVGAPYQSKVNLYNGAVYRFLNQGRVYGTIKGTVQNPTVVNGDSIRINDIVVVFNSTTLDTVVTAINTANNGGTIPGVTAFNDNGYLKIVSDSVISANKLRILPNNGSALSDLGLDIFKQVELINNSTPKSYDYFGKIVKINKNSDLLVVASDIAATNVTTQFDANVTQTTFDAKSTNFVEPISNSGAVWVYSYLQDSRASIFYPGEFAFVQQLTPTNAGGSLLSNDGFGSSIDISDYTMLVGARNTATQGFHTGTVYVFTDADELLGWDIIRSKEPTVDINSIIKGYVYSVANQTISYYLDFIDPAKGKILGLAEQELSYKIDYDPAVYNNSSLDTVSQNTSMYWTDQQVGQLWWDLSTVRYIDYEQGSIKYRTANWGREFPGSSIDVYEWVESIYPPSRYVANGGDGIPKYPDNEAYVSLEYIDPATNYATVKYYFWVKDKTTLVVNQFGRSIPTTTVADYIRNPKSSGIDYFAAIRADSFAIFNAVNKTTGKDTVMHIDYTTKLNSNVIHSEYALLSENNSKSSFIPQNILNKMIDSLSGIDVFGNPVPDPTLPVQTRYGIDFRPRQSMVVNKNAAIKEIITYVNNILRYNVVSQGYDLSILESGEPYPSANSGQYDAVVDNLEELDYINIVIRPVGYKVLVKNDSSVGNLWTIYIKDLEVTEWAPNTAYLIGQAITYNAKVWIVTDNFTSGAEFNYGGVKLYNAQNVWHLIRVESYYVPDYWKSIDWYAPGFDKSANPTYTIATSAEISDLALRNGDTVKINNNGQGKWYIIQVFPDIVNTVAIQDGTIEFTDNLYDLETYGMSFDGGTFDNTRFDQNPALETRQIIRALQDNIFINQLDHEFVKMFFVLVNYILTEQTYVDWLFKTSFINVLQKIKGLTQPQIYVKENQEFYIDYINEVKPYKTTVREYVVDYEAYDNYNGYVTDFDVPSYYDSSLKLYRSPSGEFISDALALQRPEYRDWLYNYQYKIGAIQILNGGSGYTIAPEVIITGSSIGNNAVAKAFITNGVVTRIELLYSGTSYITTPQVTLVGGNGTGAYARAIVDNPLIRNIKTTLVYNRYTYGTIVKEWLPNTLYTQGTILTYNSIAYIVDQTFTSGTVFSLNNLTVYPVTSLTSANDRIQAYYQPELGQPGKNFGMLETGIDYPGVQVDGLPFNETGGFDAIGFDTTPYDPLKINTDGVYVVDDDIVDTTITADYADTSLGIRPEDIIVDGGPYVYDYFRDWTANTSYVAGDILSYNNKFWYIEQNFTSNATFDDSYLTNYNIGPYASHGPEELLPGRVFDTLDMTVTTIAADPQDPAYIGWIENQGIQVVGINVIDPGLGYNASTVSITIDGGSPHTIAVAQVTLNPNGSAASFSIVNAGAGYELTPTITVTGSNTAPMILSPIMGLSDAPASADPYPSMRYRIFKDMNDNYTYLRLDGAASTILTANLGLTDTEVFVANVRVLPEPAAAGAQPGVVFIDGERITYYEKDLIRNSIKNLRRGTAGTGANVHYINASVVDGSQNQLVIDSSNYTWFARQQGQGNITVYANTTVNSNASIITGFGTSFTTELSPGMELFVGTDYLNTVSSTYNGNVASLETTRTQYLGTIASIESNTSLTLQTLDPVGVLPTNYATISANNTAYWFAANISARTISYSGNVSANTQSNIITGINSIFTLEFNVGNSIFDANGVLIGNIANIVSNTEAVLSSNGLANVSGNITSYYSFTANTPYIRSNLWYTLGTGTATNGGGLFVANTIQSSFIRQGDTIVY